MYTLLVSKLVTRIRPSGAVAQLCSNRTWQISDLVLPVKRRLKKTAELCYCYNHIEEDYWSCLEAYHTAT